MAALSYGTPKGVVTEFFVSDTMAGNHAKMDARVSELQGQPGITGFGRRKIGRNATCPCGSGLKFKKCCIHKAH